jgi:hypothetical protein
MCTPPQWLVSGAFSITSAYVNESPLMDVDAIADAINTSAMA